MKKLTEGNIYKNFLLFAIPMVLSAILSEAFATIDTMIAGKFLGQNGLAATGATGPFVTFVSSIFWGYGSGFSIYIARLFGAGQYKKMKSEIFNNLLLVSLLVGGISCLLILCRKGIYQILNIDPVILEQADQYFLIYISGLVLMILNTFGVFIMNALGSSTFPFLMSVLSAVVNITGNILSVTVLNWGVAGIAVSSVLAALTVDLCYFLKLRHSFRQLGVHNEKITVDLNRCKSSLVYSLPTCLQQGVMYFASLVMSPIINGLGAAATAGYSVASLLYSITLSMYNSASKTLGNYVAQSIGAGQFKNVRKGLRVGLVQGVVFGLPVVIGCMAFAVPLCGLFFPAEESGPSFEYAVLFARVFLPFSMINFINNLFHAFFRGMTASKELLISTLTGAASKAVFSLILAPFFGMTGIYLGWLLSWVVEAVYCLSTYLLKFRNDRMIGKYLKVDGV